MSIHCSLTKLRSHKLIKPNPLQESNSSCEGFNYYITVFPATNTELLDISGEATSKLVYSVLYNIILYIKTHIKYSKGRANAMTYKRLY